MLKRKALGDLPEETAMLVVKVDYFGVLKY